VLDVVAPFVDRLLAACADVTVLATSRERLGVPAERIMLVPPLSLDRDGDSATGDSDAATLFVERARAVDAVFEYDEQVVAALCARLDGYSRSSSRPRAAHRSAWAALRTRRSPSTLDGGRQDSEPPFVAGVGDHAYS
jgi:predicted ATPase